MILLLSYKTEHYVYLTIEYHQIDDPMEIIGVTIYFIIIAIRHIQQSLVNDAIFDDR